MPLVARSLSVGHVTHNVVTHRWLIHNAVVCALQPIVEPTHRQLAGQSPAERTDAGVGGILNLFKLAVAPRAHDQFLIARAQPACLHLEPNEVIDVALIENVVPAAIVVNGHLHLLPVPGHFASLVVIGVVVLMFESFLQHPLGLLSLEPILVHLFAKDSAHKGGLFISARPRNHHKRCDQMRRICHRR